MKIELQKKLQEEFPFMRPLPRRGHKFLYPMDFGIECGDGWFGLIRELCRKIQVELNKMPKKKRNKFYVFQVKEKLGGLRFYINWGTEEILNAIDDAEERSYEICEACGRKGRLGKIKGWYVTRCGRCDTKDFVPVGREVQGNVATIDKSVSTLKLRIGEG